MDDLIARLEAATGPDRELDAAIAVATTPGMFSEGGFVGFTGAGDMCSPPAYTASIDAALTLVPEGWGFMSLGADPYEQDAFCVTVYDRRHWNRHREWPEGSITTGYSFATPALAISIAALRAGGSHD